MLQRRAGRGDEEVQAGWESGCFGPGAGRGATAGSLHEARPVRFPLPGGFEQEGRGERRCWPVCLGLAGEGLPGRPSRVLSA